eukprot:3793612-Heterocapsa_arctica.AAC.1
MNIETYIRVTEMGNGPEVLERKLDNMHRMFEALKARVKEMGNGPEALEWKIDKTIRMFEALTGRVDDGLPPEQTEEWLG